MSREPHVAWADDPPTSMPGAVKTDDLVRDLLKWEGQTSFLYKDSRGFVTCGIGNLVANADTAASLPWMNAKTGAPATRAEIATAFAAVANAPTGQGAGKYASLTSIRLPHAVVTDLAARRLEREFLPALRQQFPGFDAYPAPARRALVDMAYNLGTGGLEKFKSLRTACAAGDWQLASAECHRKTSRPERNDATRDLFLEAARLA